MSAIEQIEKLALALPLNQRVLLAETLLESVPPLGEEMTESQEMAEVERREMEIKSGKSLPMAEDEFWQKVHADGT
jgi:putative addiction module component (TIGR02574 family)